MALIPDLYHIISEYTDPETYTLLKSLNIPVISIHKYQNLLAKDFTNIVELENLKIEYRRLHEFCENQQSFFDDGLMVELIITKTEIGKLLFQKIQEVAKILEILYQTKYSDLTTLKYDVVYVHLPHDQIIFNLSEEITQKSSQFLEERSLLWKAMINLISDFKYYI